MKELLFLLVAASSIHQVNHWNSNGNSFYGDHLLYGRLYDEVQDGIDQVAEKLIGLDMEKFIDVKEIATNVQQIVQSINPENSSVEIESLILQKISETLQGPDVTPGMSNLLEDLHDTHEGFVYLLKQRVASSVPAIAKLAQDYLGMSSDFNNNEAAKLVQQAMSKASETLNLIDVYDESELYGLVREAAGYLQGMVNTVKKDVFQQNLQVSLPKLKTLLQMCLEKSQGQARSNLMTVFRLINSIKY